MDPDDDNGPDFDNYSFAEVRAVIWLTAAVMLADFSFLFVSEFMKKALSVMALFLSAASANATLTLCEGPSGCTIQGPGIENVLFPNVGDTGFLITGSTNQSNTLIDFTSSEEMIVTGGGQAKLEAVDGSLGDVNVQAQLATIGFTHFIFNVHADVTGTINVAATDNFGTVFDFGPKAASQNGQNWFTIGSLDDQYIKSVAISGIGITGIDELQQVRVDPATLPTTPPPGPVSEVPIPAAAWLFGSALIGLGGVARKRKA
jgi:hypothetical protein